MRRHALVLSLAALVALVGGVACGKSEPAPPAGAGVVPPKVASDVPADFTFRWPEPARARMTVRVGGGATAMAMVGQLTLGARDAQGHRRLAQTAWEPAGGPADDIMTALMNTYSEDGLVVRADGGTVDEEAGLWWSRWVEIWAAYSEVAVGTEHVLPAGSEHLPPGVEVGLTRVGPSSFDANALRLVYRLTAVEPRGRESLEAMLGLSERVERKQGLPTSIRFEGDVDPRTLQPLRVDVVTQLERADEPFTLSFEFDWSP